VLSIPNRLIFLTKPDESVYYTLLEYFNLKIPVLFLWLGREKKLRRIPRRIEIWFPVNIQNPLILLIQPSKSISPPPLHPLPPTPPNSNPAQPIFAPPEPQLTLKVFPTNSNPRSNTHFPHNPKTFPKGNHPPPSSQPYNPPTTSSHPSTQTSPYSNPRKPNSITPHHPLSPPPIPPPPPSSHTHPTNQPP